MANVTLKKALRDGSGFTDDSSGRPSALYDLLKSMIESPPFSLEAIQAAVATGIVATMWTTKATRLRKLWVRATVAGSANATTVQVLVNGVLATGATLTLDNAETDPDFKSLDLDVPVPAGARVDLNISAAATGATGLAYQADFNNITIEP